MLTFLFEQYGYYPKEINDNSFFLNGWRFKLVASELNGDSIMRIEEYTNILNKEFYNKGPFIIKNKANSNISILNNTNYVLVSILQANMNFQDLIKFHLLFYKDDEYIELDKILLVWKDRVDTIEKKLNTYLRIDSLHYKHNLDVSVFAIGLAINAMQYLSDIINNYDNKLYGVTIAHKRLYDLTSFDFLNPFNFIVESPLKDISLLYQNNYISFEEFKYLLQQYKVDLKSATFLLARLLYRSDIFDQLEDKRDLEKGDQQIKFNFEKEMYKIKKAYAFLKENYTIRPIDWLESHL